MKSDSSTKHSFPDPCISDNHWSISEDVW